MPRASVIQETLFPCQAWACKHHSCVRICFTCSSLTVLASSSALFGLRIASLLMLRMCGHIPSNAGRQLPALLCFAKISGSGYASRPHKGWASCLLPAPSLGCRCSACSQLPPRPSMLSLALSCSRQSEHRHLLLLQINASCQGCKIG